MSLALQDLPTRAATGAYIAHSGWEKWNAGEEQAQGLHGMASGAYPFLRQVPPPTFVKALAAAEMAVGAALLVPVVPNKIAGGLLSGFAGGLLGLYARTPGLRQPGSVWPTPEGIGISKDVWMLGIGLGLLVARR